MALYGSEHFERLFRRCLVCPTETPSCPTCDTGYQCEVSVPTCDTCPATSCVLAPSAQTSTSSSSSHNSPNVGAIAGGVIAGVVLIAVVTYLVWRFCIKTRRQQYEQEHWGEDSEPEAPGHSDEKSTFAMQRDARASTYTVGSIASTVLTRASNVIQIAYIPGVTNRSTPSTPGLLVPPVPPIPIALSSAASTPLYDDQHFFMPGDLRDSTYSGISDRTSYARTSVASTIYGKNAIVSPLPAQTSTVIRGKAAVVSVGSKNPNNPGELTPPVPSLDYSKYKTAGPPSPAFSVGSTFLSNASAATAMKPTMVSVSTSGSKGSGLSKTTNASDDSSSADEIPYRDFPTPPGNAKGNRDTSGSKFTLTTFIDDSSNPNSPRRSQSPFDDPPLPSASKDRSDTVSLSKVIEEATRRASGRPKSGLGARTPFGDENKVE